MDSPNAFRPDDSAPRPLDHDARAVRALQELDTMPLTTDQLSRFRTDGYLLLDRVFTAEEMARLRTEAAREFAIDSPRRVLEKDAPIVRSVYGSHATNAVFANLARHPRLVRPAQQILDDDVYVYQFKINAKAAFRGDVWEWHQDYIFWRNEDGMPTPAVINVVVFLDDVTEFNGPMYVVPGSHRAGVVEPEEVTADPGAAYQSSPAWINNLTARLKYSLSPAAVAAAVRQSRIDAPKGPAGSVLLFDANLLHASPPNLSPFDRTLCIATYNSVRNVPRAVSEPRPAFLVSRDVTRTTVVDDDVLSRA
jgi:ectoine hydroxylase